MLRAPGRRRQRAGTTSFRARPSATNGETAVKACHLEFVPFVAILKGDEELVAVLAFQVIRVL